IAASIKEFGFLNPIIIDGDNSIIAGHGRVMAAQKLGIKELPCIEASHLTDTQRRAYIIADNKLALNAGWDDDMLRIELDELGEAGFDLELTGFSLDEIDELQIEEIEDGLTDEDDVPELVDDPVSVQGDVWLLGKHRLMCGDSTSIDAVEELMEGQKADLLHTDPPYGVSYEGGHNQKKRKGIIADTLEGDDLTGLFRDSLSAALVNTKEGAAFYVWYASGKSVETYAALSTLPLKLRTVIQWYKVRSGLGAFMSQYIPNCEPCMYLHKEGSSPAWYGPTTEKTVWELQRQGANEYHPTQKPVELPERVINNSSKKGDFVLDLFGGSGSTLIACEKTGRHARLMELDPKYVDVIIKRWQDFTGKQAVHEATGEPFNDMFINGRVGDKADV
ncbi:MAG TPA: site-specific DNA-methyltransferase, partial [Thiopseudomonas sp.]|nr:site-specific DNA-methyltransferase [Thiopseudomonas sp.]